MPERFQGRRIPAKMYAYPFDHVVAGVLIAVGVVATALPQFAPASVNDLPLLWANLFRAMCLGGGILVAAGLTKGEHRWGFTSEMVGMILAAGVFGTYALGLMLRLGERPGGFLAFLFLTLWSLACLLRARAISIQSALRLKQFMEAAETKRSQEG